MTEETWIHELTSVNFLAVYDVLLDLHSALQMSDTATIPVMPGVIKFPALMPADTTTLRDEYCTRRYRAIELLHSKGVITEFRFPKTLVPWGAVIHFRADNENCASVLEEFRLVRARQGQQEPDSAASPSVENAPPSSQEISAPSQSEDPNTNPAMTSDDASLMSPPEKVTIAWLVRHVPVKIWLSLIVFLFSLFVAGVHTGQTTFVQELYGTTRSKSIARPVESVPQLVIEDKIDDLIKGYTESLNRITESITAEEERAGGSSLSPDARNHRQSADRLKEFLNTEHDNFRRVVTTFRSLAEPSER